MSHPKIIRSLLAAARRQKLRPDLLAGTGKLDYSSSHRMLNGKATRPSFAMVEGLAKATGFKLVLVAVKGKVRLKKVVRTSSKRKPATKRKPAAKRITKKTAKKG